MEKLPWTKQMIEKLWDKNLHKKKKQLLWKSEREKKNPENSEKENQ